MGIKAVSASGSEIPANGAIVTDGQVVEVKGADGTRTLSTGGVSHVASGSFSSLWLPNGSTVITTLAGSVNVQDADGTSVGCSPVIATDGLLTYIGMPGTAGIATNAGAVKVANSNGGGPIDSLFAITGGFITSVNLKNATDTLVSNGFTTSITGYPADSFAACNISSSGLQSVTVTLPSTAALVTSGQELTIPVTGTYVSKATLTVSGNGVTEIVLS